MNILLTFDGGRLEAPTDDQLAVLARAAAEPEAVLTAETSHFVTWLHDRTSDEIAIDRVARVRSNRDLTKRPGWTLDLAVVVSGEPVGMQTLSGFDRWPRGRTVGTTSWVLEDNRASVAVSTKLGYDLVDRHDITEHGSRYTEHVYGLDRDVWLQSAVRRRYLPVVTGAEPLTEVLNHR